MKDIEKNYSFMRGRVMVRYGTFGGFSRCVINLSLFNRVHKVVWNSFKVPDVNIRND